MVWWIAQRGTLLGPTCCVLPQVLTLLNPYKNNFPIFICCLSDPTDTFFLIHQCTRDKIILIISIIRTSLLLFPLTFIDSPILSTKRIAPCLLRQPHEPLLLFISLTQCVLFCCLKPLTFISQDKINASVVWCCWHGYLPMWWMAVITCRHN